jgi:antitoxin ParD1/3/4/toxin ParE1/3/4
MKYRLTLAEVQDIREITRHIRIVQKSPQNAALVAKRLKKQFEQLVQSPRLGHHRKELNDDAARVLPVTGVLVIYDPSLKPLTILRIIHAARDLQRIDLHR